jgi:3-hydroxyisobutyrate dehydrogenase
MIHSTVALATLRRAGDEAARRGVALIEAAVSGRDGHRSIGELCVMVGGERAAFERARPALDAIGSLVLHLGPLGAGMDAKLVRNAIVYQQFVAGHEGMLLARKLGVARADVRAILEHTGVLGANLAAFLDEQPGSNLLAGTVGTARKDLTAALERAAEVGARLPGVALARERIAAAFGVEPPAE